MIFIYINIYMDQKINFYFLIFETLDPGGIPFSVSVAEVIDGEFIAHLVFFEDFDDS